jgi:hypothetical protein
VLPVSEVEIRELGIDIGGQMKRTRLLKPRKAVTLPGGQIAGVNGQYVAGSPPSQKALPAAFIGRRWIGEPERAEMTTKGLLGDVGVGVGVLEWVGVGLRLWVEEVFGSHGLWCGSAGRAVVRARKGRTKQRRVDRCMVGVVGKM